MLRLMVLVLLLLNVGLFARGQGWLLAYGWGPTPQREPQRLAQQINPEALQVLPSAAATAAASLAAPAALPGPALAASGSAASASAAQAASATPAATRCWQVADIEPAQAEALRGVLRGNFSEGDWTLEESGLPERWMVYMGKFPNADELAKKRDQLSQLNVKFSLITSAAWGPGLSLGVFNAQEGANVTLQELARRGVRSARVVRERPSSLRYRLRLPVVSAANQSALDAVTVALPGKALEACPAPAPAPASAPAAAAPR